MGSKYYETRTSIVCGRVGAFMRHHHCQNCARRGPHHERAWPQRTGVYSVATSIARSPRTEDERAGERQQLPLDRKTIADQLKAAGYALGCSASGTSGSRAVPPVETRVRRGDCLDGQAFRLRDTAAGGASEGPILADFITDRSVAFIEKNKDQRSSCTCRTSPSMCARGQGGADREVQGQAGRWRHNNPTYAAMIASVDESVGRFAPSWMS